ncbi:MAG: hypothetical protein LUG19_12830 [Desulfovibrio sp.]|uniref:hypothetical protein n=1 Tax=Desulfovibrio sp. TaxID=885 RepID=UPI00258B79FA|nr:hypothetical protein [Desulfovibrio sp.]MCD7985116.1 hypothetical protein [Desulfovibrio sp.]
MLHSIAQKFFADFQRIFHVLPRTLRVFTSVFLQALLEIGSILAISFLAVSIVSPERILTTPSR